MEVENGNIKKNILLLAIALIGVAIVVIIVAKIVERTKESSKSISVQITAKLIIAAIIFVTASSFIAIDMIDSIVRITKEPMEMLENALNERIREIEDARDKAEHGYCVYIDGVEVDIDNVNLECYEIKIDDEKSKILLTR